MYIPDYNDLLDQYEYEREKALELLPECSNCGEKIQTEKCYEINDELICLECIKELERWTNDYIL